MRNDEIKQPQFVEVKPHPLPLPQPQPLPQHIPHEGEAERYKENFFANVVIRISLYYCILKKSMIKPQDFGFNLRYRQIQYLLISAGKILLILEIP